jgi:hypothetical protein
MTKRLFLICLGLLFAASLAVAVELGDLIKDFGVNSRGIGLAVFGTSEKGIVAFVVYADLDKSLGWSEGDKIISTAYGKPLNSEPNPGVRFLFRNGDEYPKPDAKKPLGF